MLKIHCCADGSQRNALSGVVETTASSVGLGLSPAETPTSLKLVTTPVAPIETPLASHTRNFAGEVLFALNTLVPSALIGCRIWCARSPMQIPPLAYCTV